MNKLFLSIVALFIMNISFGQDAELETENFTIGGEGNISFSNTGFGDYYSGGGLGSTTVGTLLNAYANKKYANNSSWDNSLRVDYGVARVQNTNDEQFIKSSDVFDFVSKYGSPLKNSEDWLYSVAFNVLTQLTDTRTAYNEATGNFSQLEGINGGNWGTNQSTLFAPADITLGFGFDYKPNEHFSAFLGPLAGKIRVVSDDAIAASGLFGNDVTFNPATGLVTDYENTRYEAGANIITKYNNSFLENDMLNFTTGLTLFSNYLENPENVDVNWNTLTSLNPWKFITINYATDLMYDDNKSFTAFADGEDFSGVRKGIQFRNVLGIGLVHKFGDSKE